eukprot:355247-Chlamydomonas_euryale.AAC.5
MYLRSTHVQHSTGLSSLSDCCKSARFGRIKLRWIWDVCVHVVVAAVMVVCWSLAWAWWKEVSAGRAVVVVLVGLGRAGWREGSAGRAHGVHVVEGGFSWRGAGGDGGLTQYAERGGGGPSALGGWDALGCRGWKTPTGCRSRRRKARSISPRRLQVGFSRVAAEKCSASSSTAGHPHLRNVLPVEREGCPAYDHWKDRLVTDRLFIGRRDT